MKVVYNWLKEFVDVKASTAELSTRLSLCGVAIDSVEETPAGPVLDAEITSNRPDCLGHYGIAREVATIYRLPLKPVQPKLKEIADKAADVARVDIEAPELCGRFTARVMRGVKVQPSPDWLRQRLKAIGQNSINNVVDITNYVMFELGHPLHAYDLDKLNERRIVVRKSKAGEKLRTLDGAERTVAKDICVIADGAHAIGIGGVMGGVETEISFSTRNILIECAWFDPIAVRRTSKALGLRTEASYRFERGADPEMAELASRRTAELIQRVAGGEILSGVIDVYPRPEPLRKIKFTRKELLRVMGADIPDRDIEDILSALGFRPVRVDGNRGASGALVAEWECQQPSWRRDVTRGIDLVEEVARHYGYAKFPPRLPPAKQPAHALPHAEAMERIIERLVGLGYREIVAIPIVDSKLDALFRPEGVTPAVIGNPLSEDASTMRSNGIVSMASALEWNLNHGQRNLRLFEIGRTYELHNGEPKETPVLTIGATGLAREKIIWEAAREYLFADLKGDLDRIGELAGGLAWQTGGPSWLAGARAAKISLAQGNGSSALDGHAGQLARRVADEFKLRQDVFVSELRLEPLLEAVDKRNAELRFKPLPRYPAVERDFSLILTDGVTFRQVEETIRAQNIPEVQNVLPIDRISEQEIRELVNRGDPESLEGIYPPGTHVLTVRISFQNTQATLTELQVAEFSARIVSALIHELGVKLRAS
jgi:phenylalanyl-tRNA synthetase beta chain